MHTTTMPKRGINPVTEKLSPPDRVEQSPLKFQKIAQKKERDFRRLMNCKNLDKFSVDRKEDVHKDYPHARPQRLRMLNRSEIRAHILAGGRIRYDPWAFKRTVEWKGRIMGTCTMADITELLQSGFLREVPVQFGYREYYLQS